MTKETTNIFLNATTKTLYRKRVERINDRYEIIDLLRGLAILLVVIRHVQLRIPFEKIDALTKFSDQILSAIFMSGNEGVRIFFVISGFLITMNTLKRYSNLNSIKVKEFYVSRFARIAPCLIGLLIILTALHYLGVKNYVINSRFNYLETLFSALTFHLNWLEGQKGYLPGSWDVLWSLSVEEAFYLAFPIACLSCRNKNILYALLIALVLIGPLNRFLLEGNKIWQSKAYLSCMDSIALGCFFALISHKKTFSKFATRCLSSIGVLMVTFVLMVKRDPSFDVVGQLYLFKTILSLGVGLILVGALNQRFRPAFRKIVSPLTLYGRLSYEIYLTHMFVVYTGIKLYKTYDVSLNNSLFFLIAIVIISGILGYAVERLFSTPMNNWIRNQALTN